MIDLSQLCTAPLLCTEGKNTSAKDAPVCPQLHLLLQTPLSSVLQMHLKKPRDPSSQHNETDFWVRDMRMDI